MERSQNGARKSNSVSEFWSAQVVFTTKVKYKFFVKKNVNTKKVADCNDTLATENNQSFSLNIVWRQVLPLETMACSTRFKPRALFGNLQKVFLQVRVKTRDRDPNQLEVFDLQGSSSDRYSPHSFEKEYYKII